MIRRFPQNKTPLWHEHCCRVPRGRGIPCELINKVGVGIGIQISLLDRGLGHPIQAWDFSDRDEISIGRAKDADVRIVDPLVSRVHAKIVHRSGAWRLHALGRAGVFVNGESISWVPLTEGAIFHLGANGPSLQFLGEADAESHSEDTQSIDLDTLTGLFIDPAARDTEVKQVMESDFFKQIRQQAARLRSTAEGTEEV